MQTKNMESDQAGIANFLFLVIAAARDQNPMISSGAQRNTGIWSATWQSILKSPSAQDSYMACMSNDSKVIISRIAYPYCTSLLAILHFSDLTQRFQHTVSAAEHTPSTTMAAQLTAGFSFEVSNMYVLLTKLKEN